MSVVSRQCCCFMNETLSLGDKLNTDSWQHQLSPSYTLFYFFLCFVPLFRETSTYILRYIANNVSGHNNEIMRATSFPFLFEAISKTIISLKKYGLELKCNHRDDPDKILSLFEIPNCVSDLHKPEVCCNTLQQPCHWMNYFPHHPNIFIESASLNYWGSGSFVFLAELSSIL